MRLRRQQVNEYLIWLNLGSFKSETALEMLDVT